MTDQDQRYNGWTNYETWGVALVLDNDEGTYNMVREQAGIIAAAAEEDPRVRDGIWTAGQAAKYNLADWLKDFTEELCGLEGEGLGIPEPSMMAKQLLAGAISDVDFAEIAENVLAE